MAGSPDSAIITSDFELPSSPAPRNFSRWESDDDHADSRAYDSAADGTDKAPSRAKGKSSADREAKGAATKTRHLKKDDGDPLWRTDIQYDFLRAIFDNEEEVFTNSYEPDRKQNFADLYIDTMSRSSKTSKVLREKLLKDREAAKGIAMVCLLVNVGRMNTTLNFFPEMRAQLRTYHAIPSLQAHQDAHAYKQLQDAPRLKSILKGGTDDREEPIGLQTIKDADAPRTNPVNLLFTMCSNAVKIAELHFPTGQEFHDLIVRPQYSSKSRANAFLWLMWFYLESDFTEEGCEENPFGPGVDYGMRVANQGIPRLQELTEEEMALENKDTEVEIEFGLQKKKTRQKILELDQAFIQERESKRVKSRLSMMDDGASAASPVSRVRSAKHESDMDSVRSTPPPRSKPIRVTKGNVGVRRAVTALKYGIYEDSSPAGPAQTGAIATRKPRPPTAHQLAVERHRNIRVEYILDKGLKRLHHQCRKQRRQDGAIYRAYSRVTQMADPWSDSEGEEKTPHNCHPPATTDAGNDADVPAADRKEGDISRERAVGGLSLLRKETDDYGEEVYSYAAAVRRASRRLTRWHGHEEQLGVIPPIKKDSEGRSQETAADEDYHQQLADAAADLHALKVRIRLSEAAKKRRKPAKPRRPSKAAKQIKDEPATDEMDMDELDQTALADEEDRADDDMEDPDQTVAMGDSDLD